MITLFETYKKSTDNKIKKQLEEIQKHTILMFQLPEYDKYFDLTSDIYPENGINYYLRFDFKEKESELYNWRVQINIDTDTLVLPEIEEDQEEKNSLEDFPEEDENVDDEENIEDNPPEEDKKHTIDASKILKDKLNIYSVEIGIKKFDINFKQLVDYTKILEIEKISNTRWLKYHLEKANEDVLNVKNIKKLKKQLNKKGKYNDSIY